ncbi:MAG: terminase gpA endonuclease subunit [Phycisphaeraceae bacterium]
MSGHPGALRLLATTFAEVIRPIDRVAFSHWLPQNIVLVDGEHAGEAWGASGAPYLPEIADCLSDDHPCNLVTVRKSQQSGASILALAWCLYIADQEPANVLYGTPGIDALRSLNGQKLQPLIDAWHKRIGRTVIYPQTSRSAAGSTTYEKRFAGGFLSLANVNAIMDLSMITAKKGVKDEVSKWQQLENGADPENLYFGRFTAFRRTKSWKILEISTPEVDTGDEHGEAEGHCRIDRSFRRSDQRYWNCACPACRQPFVHRFDNLRVDEQHPHRSVYEHACGHRISEAERVVAVRGGHWEATVAGEYRHPGFHVDAFISLMMSYEAIAEDFLRAKSEPARKDFSTLVLGLPFKFRGDAPDHVRLMERRAAYERHVIPPDGLILVCGADVQHNGIWFESVAFAPDRQSWCIDRDFIDGDTTEPDRGAFAALAELYERPFADSFGGTRLIDAIAVDAGDGGRANQVYAFCRGRARAFAIAGAPGWSHPALGTPKEVDINLAGRKVTRGAKRWPVGTWSLKAEFYANLRKPGRKAGEERDPPGYCHFGDWLDEAYFKQITSEHLETVRSRGRVTQVWSPTGPNHLLDCRIYAMAMAEYLGLTRMTGEHWKILMQERGVPIELQQPDLLAPDSVKIVARPPLLDRPPRGRRVISSGIN